MTCGRVEWRVGEVVGPRVRLGVGHAGVVVPEEVQRRVPDRLDAGAQLVDEHLGQVVPHVGSIGGRVEDVAGLATGGAHEDAADALGGVLGDRARALRRLVVRMRVHRKEA